MSLCFMPLGNLRQLLQIRLHMQWAGKESSLHYAKTSMGIRELLSFNSDACAT